jgi:hypothetical protein
MAVGYLLLGTVCARLSARPILDRYSSDASRAYRNREYEEKQKVMKQN